MTALDARKLLGFRLVMDTMRTDQASHPTGQPPAAPTPSAMGIKLGTKIGMKMPPPPPPPAPQRVFD